MKLSFSTNAFTRFSIFEAVESIAKAGYEGVELLADKPHLYPPTTADPEVEKLGLLLESLGLKVANLNANTAMGYYKGDFYEPLFEPSLANPNPEARRWRLEYSRRCIDLALLLGCRNISITSGRMVPGLRPQESLALLKGSLMVLLEHAVKADVRVGMEYEPGLLVERFEELAEILDELDCAHLGVNLDLGHSHVMKEDPKTVLSALGPSIFHVHMEDIRGGKHYHLIPGQGDMDLTRLLRLLEDQGYEGFVTTELYTYSDRPEEAAREALVHLQQCLNRL